MVTPATPEPPATAPGAPVPAAPAEADTRPASLWPATTRQPHADANTHFDPSRFDPLHDEQQRQRERLSTPFDLCRPAVGLRVLIFIQLVVLVVALPASDHWYDWAFRAVSLAFAGLGGGLIWVPAVCALRGVLSRRPAGVVRAVVVMLGAFASLAGWGLMTLLALAPVTPFAAVAAALSGAALAALVWQWLTMRSVAALPVEASARLVELQSRIRPHFLFNALNTALALVRIDPARAESVLEDLSQLFRVALAETGSAVSLDEEIELAQRYLAIEQLRFGKRLQVVWDLDPAAAAARVPPLVLQPLVENAVRHGIEPAVGGGRVLVRSRARLGMVELLVSNSLPDEPGPPGSGIALENVRERLHLLHDLAATLETGVVDGQFQARISVPL
ncbi:sensor histidine kinase [Aquabacterium sp.]|uniref:sensor histidine kinase n=1 Tax=Aquabacterium sp. TaxID=1872578 RepID=UPI002C4034C7|nr:histidine kinase [Aquabacterium sp.]HSW07227.1 histidine kinase [Aquabacterium sp.]